MDTQTLTVLIIDGGLILLFLYALYYISKPGKNTAYASEAKKPKEDPVAVKISDYEPKKVYEQSEETLKPQTKSTVIDPPTDLDIQKETTETQDVELSVDVENLPEQENNDDVSTNTESIEGIDLIEIEGIGEIYAQKLYNIDIYTVQELLERGATREGREEIASMSEISPKLILEWVNHADLFRVDGVGGQYSDLLEDAGVDTIPELARRNPENLLNKMREVNQEKNLVKLLPSLNSIENWIEQARKLPRKIEY